ncbi:hypothetical protein N0V90_007132 [Kalmusia sp. IMI 367209]|nr:hypothetical protein N0V90_007132 [Kalmusia sp. IMI 367209]
MTGTREIAVPPTSLFAAVTAVSLSGTVSYRLLSTILSNIEPSTLRHLRFNNLQTFSEPLKHLRRQVVIAHRCARPGPAYGYLRKWTGRCSTLQSFHYLSTALVSANVPRVAPSLRSKLVADENNRYAEVASFIGSVRPTLRELLFEHGPDNNYFTMFVMTLPNNNSRTDPLPMDVFFNTHVFPVLTSAWPRLRSMVVRGIGHWISVDPWKAEATPEDHNWLHSKTAEFRRSAIALHEAVPEGCKVVVEDEASRPFYRLQDDSKIAWRGDLNGD